jgi:ribosomal protein S24E
MNEQEADVVMVPMRQELYEKLATWGRDNELGIVYESVAALLEVEMKYFLDRESYAHRNDNRKM